MRQANATGSERRHLAAVRRLRAAYRRAVEALPWLDASTWEDDAPAFPEYAQKHELPSVEAMPADPGMAGELAKLGGRKLPQGEGVLLRYDPERSGPPEALGALLSEMVAQGVPLVVLHTDVELGRIGDLASRWPRLQIIVESGPLKILYYLAELAELLAGHANVYLCTHNLCNWLGLEGLCEKGLGGRLLFGSHSPRHSPHAAMGPIAMGRLTWREKCDIAGNNLRRLLGLPVAEPQEVEFTAPAPFVVDAHAHSGPSGRFPVPDEEFGPEGWLQFMDECAIERIYICPFEAIADGERSAREKARAFRASAPGRFFYFEVFRPEGTAAQMERLEAALEDPGCVGMKIHPSMHEVEADDEAYAPVYELAERRGVPILTHSWDVSETNPVQYMSHPERFRRHLREHPRVRLVLGHAGGRPGAMEAVTGLCRDYPELRVDLAGDYYDNGLVELLVDRVGADRVIFGSDVNWIDPRANLGPILAGDLPDETVLAILRGNALATYRKAETT